MKRAGIFDTRPLGLRLVVAVRLVDGHAVEHLDDAALHSLQLVAGAGQHQRSEEHTSELQSPCNLVCRLLLEKKKSPHIAEGKPNLALIIGGLGLTSPRT